MPEGLYPPERKKMDPKDYERVPVGVFVTGEIAEVQHEKDHIFKGKNATTADAIRFKLTLDGLKFPHYSRWMTFTTSEKSNLYLKWLSALVEGAKPDMNINIKILEHLRIKMIWINDPRNPDFQSIQLVLPADDVKILAGETPPPAAEGEDVVPF